MSETIKWTDDFFLAEMRRVIGDKGYMPTHAEISKAEGNRVLSGQITKRGGIKKLASDMGLESLEPCIDWTDALRESELRKLVGTSGVMPSIPDIARASGDGALSKQISSHGGVRYWAERLGLTLKDSATKRGQDSEEGEGIYFESLGYAVERQTTRAPFDMLVNGKRVDVKRAVWTQYVRQPGTRQEGQKVAGYVFAGLKNGKTCDFFDLVCVENDATKHRFIIPATSAQVRTITITKKTLEGAGKYAFFKDRVDLLK